jgi:hypothetical protein
MVYYNLNVFFRLNCFVDICSYSKRFEIFMAVKMSSGLHKFVVGYQQFERVLISICRVTQCYILEDYNRDVVSVLTTFTLKSLFMIVLTVRYLST